jgi:hypothetical protein
VGDNAAAMVANEQQLVDNRAPSTTNNNNNNIMNIATVANQRRDSLTDASLTTNNDNGNGNGARVSTTTTRLTNRMAPRDWYVPRSSSLNHTFVANLCRLCHSIANPASCAPPGRVIERVVWAPV